MADKLAFFKHAIPAAKFAGHVFPEYAACEAALESAWGTSKLAQEANNLFGQKHGHTSTEFPLVDIPTHEFINGKWIQVGHETWPVFPDWQTSFSERMEVLRGLSVYRDALNAPDGEMFVREVSKHWATDPNRADNVLATYRFNQGIIQQCVNA